MFLQPDRGPAERLRVREADGRRPSVAVAQCWTRFSIVSDILAALTPPDFPPWWLKAVAITIVMSLTPCGMFHLIR